MAAEGFPRRSARPRLRHSRTRASGALWHLRHRRQHRLGQRGHRPRHRGFRNQCDPEWVTTDGPRALSRGQKPADHRRWRRKQRLTGAAMEAGAAKAGRRTRYPDHHLSLLPPGTSKWNKIEHRLFSFIPSNWRGRPLVSYQTIVQLIAATTTDAGLTVR